MPAHGLDIDKDWAKIRCVFKRAQDAGLCHYFATVNEDGTPNITPIGSLVLTANSPNGLYFDVFNRALADNVDSNPDVAILAVDSRKLFWLRSIIGKRFSTPPAIRLIGKAGVRRQATPEEVNYIVDQVRFLKIFGKSKKFGNRLNQIREIKFTRVDVLKIGAMTNHPW